MKALILAAGYGKRLGEVTKSTPKCLIKYNENQTMLDMWIKKLLNSGINNIVINTHYKSKKVIDHINMHYSKFPLIKTTFEQTILGTGMTLFKNKSYFKNSDGIILHADNYAPNLNLKKFINYHYKRPKNSEITILAFKTKDYKNSGIIKLKQNKMLKTYYEKQQKKYGSFANGAIYILTKLSLKKFIKPKFNNLFIDICAQYKKLIYVYKYNGIFVDIGSLKNYKKIIKYN